MRNVFEYASFKIEKQKSDFAQKLQIDFLEALLVIAAGASMFSALFASIHFLPFGFIYILTLIAYAIISLIVYWKLHKKEHFYATASYIFTYTSLFTFIVMTIDVPEDSFRFIWFFLLSFTAYTLGGRKYGVYFALLIYVSIVWLYFTFDLHLFWIVLVTFMASFTIFNAFMLYFLYTINTDITTLHKQVDLEVIKREKHEQTLLRKYRMAHMGEMIDTIAHQWRQPLAQVDMILMNMEEELDNRAYLAQKIEQLGKLQMHMSQTIEDFRYLLHETKEKNTFDVSSAIDEVLGLMKNVLKEIDVRVNVMGNCHIDGYKNELIQTLIMILSNAKEALVSKDILQPYIEISYSADLDHCMICIEDNAGGIEDSMIAKIFDPYVTSKASSGGTGLGLYIANIIVKDNMAGALSVVNTQQGAKFTIEIPRC
jgi:signal transduction histidine kinase